MSQTINLTPGSFGPREMYSLWTDSKQRTCICVIYLYTFQPLQCFDKSQQIFFFTYKTVNKKALSCSVLSVINISFKQQGFSLPYDASSAPRTAPGPQQILNQCLWSEKLADPSNDLVWQGWPQNVILNWDGGSNSTQKGPFSFRSAQGDAKINKFESQRTCSGNQCFLCN